MSQIFPPRALVASALQALVCNSVTEKVLADDFLTDNYLSTERRIPVTVVIGQR